MAVDTIARSIASGRVPITAYDMAVAGGYTGTKEEFEADMGNSATNATNAANSAAAAAESAAEASAIADDIAQYTTSSMTAPANITEGEYILAAGTLYRATANIASGSTLTPNGNVTQVTVGEELTNVIASDANKADVDGNYPDLTAGNAEQLVSTVGIEDQVPYNFRTSGGTADIGDRETDMIVGGTVAWNQWLDDNTPKVSSGATITGSDGVYTFTAGAQNDQVYMQQGSSLVVGNHVYLCSVTFSTSDPANVKARMFSQDIESDDTTGWQTKAKLRKSASTGSFTIGVRDTRASGWDGVVVKWFMIFDLTQMFGTTIADYVYSLEQASAGAGVAWFRKLFPNDYYAYDDGTLRSVQTSAHNMVGFNAYDNTTGTARLLGGMQYQITGTYTAISCSTGETITPDASGYFTPTSNGTLTVTGGDSSTTCVHLVWDGERDGQFEAYTEHTYPLDDSLMLLGVPTLDGNNKLRYDGDTYASDGTVTRNCASVISTDCAFGKYGTTLGRWVLTIPDEFPAIKYVTTSEQLQGYNSGGFDWKSKNEISAITPYQIAEIDGSAPKRRFIITLDTNTITTVEEGQAWVNANPFWIVYPVDSPTTETAAPYTNPQIVDDFGTEEYVDAGVEAGARDVAIPVGHQTFYQQNLKSKLEMMADSPDGDGDYILRQTNGENVYVPLIIPTELPQIPGTDGVYTLKATVTGGTAVLSWEAMS